MDLQRILGKLELLITEVKNVNLRINALDSKLDSVNERLNTIYLKFNKQLCTLEAEKQKNW